MRRRLLAWLGLDRAQAERPCPHCGATIAAEENVCPRCRRILRLEGLEELRRARGVGGRPSRTA